MMHPEIEGDPMGNVPRLAWHMPSNWWTRKRSYRLFMVREVSAVFLAIFLLGYLGRLAALADGEATYYNYLQGTGGFFGILWNCLALAIVCYHAWTWFETSGIVAQVRFGGKLVPGALIVRANQIAFVAISVVLFFILT
jgi:fumarate reductase subunit C